jgi:5-methylcytosine-specific restriction endonuclease McrA
MPIRPENKDRYPLDWPAIRARILMRAGSRCEQCGVENHVYGYYDGGRFCSIGFDPTQEWDALVLDGYHVIRIVLTIAHLDHTPENCAEENLRAWCQKCHNKYDMPVRACGRKDRREAAAGQFLLQ